MEFMEFCEKCGKPLEIGKEIAQCKCGFSKKINQVSTSEKIQKIVERGKGVAKKENNEKGFPHKCKKCGHEFADVIDLGVFYSDEASIYLFKCKKCNNTERDAYGSSNT